MATEGMSQRVVASMEPDHELAVQASGDSGQEGGELTQSGEQGGYDAPEDEDEETVYNRAAALQALAEELGGAGVVQIAEAPHTLEADLLEPGEATGR